MIKTTTSMQDDFRLILRRAARAFSAEIKSGYFNSQPLIFIDVCLI